MKVTKEILVKAKACPRQVEIFTQEWPDGAVVNLKNARRAVELGLDLWWCVNNLMKLPARKAYDEAVESARKAYDEAIAPAQKALAEAIAQAQ